MTNVHNFQTEITFRLRMVPYKEYILFQKSCSQISYIFGLSLFKIRKKNLKSWERNLFNPKLIVKIVNYVQPIRNTLICLYYCNKNIFYYKTTLAQCLRVDSSGSPFSNSDLKDLKKMLKRTQIYVPTADISALSKFLRESST